jgi:hypothetical protein
MLRKAVRDAIEHLWICGYSPANIAEGCQVSAPAVSQWFDMQWAPTMEHRARLFKMACSNGFILPERIASAFDLRTEPLSNGDGDPTEETMLSMQLAAEGRAEWKRGNRPRALQLFSQAGQYLEGARREVGT